MAVITNYCTAAAVPVMASEAALGATINLPLGNPERISAIVSITQGGTITSGSTFVILQTDFGDGNWVDVGTITRTDTVASTVTYALTVGPGTSAVAVQRALGTAPTAATPGAALGFALGTRIRFTGGNTLAGSALTATATVTFVFDA